MKKHKFRDNWPAPNDYLLELGRMTTVWGSLESAVNIAISRFAGFQSPLDFRAVIMVAHSNFQQRVNIISSLCEQLVPKYPRLKVYKSVVAKIQAAQKARNKFAHNPIVWNQDTQDVKVSYVTARGSMKTSVEVVKIHDIMEATAKIHEAMCALHTLVTGRELKPMWERDA
ncbi:MAG: hypothetical protein Q8S00_31020 [Deltaproteobacteria bacterium]|nr:hypothetical protein [Deltaproteobacteria bacterium]MDZ4342286.1 hypothetical protein [Candidatus Binatia bacterium]